MSEPAPSQAEWRALYEAAIALRDLAPWEWMYDSDMFGVQNPQDGSIGYCCIMGNLGEHFALGVYLGSAGLAGYLKIQSGELWPPDLSVLHYQTCLMASFEDRTFLERQDLALIKQLGLKFRGRHSWPQFRSYRPDYHPWFVTADEARFLTLALEQACDVARRFRDNEALLEPQAEGLYLVRVSEPQAEERRWSDQWLAPAPFDTPELAAPPLDELRLQRLKNAVAVRHGVWEADFFLSPSPIQERKDERPYYPYLSLWIDRQTMMVLPPHLAAPERYAGEFQTHFLSLIEQAGAAPQEVYVLRQEAVDLLQPITQKLGIKLRLSRRLDALEDARSSLMGFMNQM